MPSLRWKNKVSASAVPRISAMKSAGAIDNARLEQMNAALERCYAATADDELYRPADFAAAIEGFRSLIR